MKIGVVREIKDREDRVALTPAGAGALVQAGHTVRVETGAGLGSGFSDSEYAAAGAELVDVEQAWSTDLVIKVKEPLGPEYPYLRAQIVFTYFHLAGVPRALTETLLREGTTAIAYETVEDTQGKLPLLAPMSAVAGTMSVTMGNYYLAGFNRGKGTLLGTLLGERHGKVLIIGDGVVGRHAAKAADGMGAQVIIFGKNPERVPELEQAISEEIRFVLSTRENITRHLDDADLVVGAVLVTGAKAPHVVSEDMVKRLPRGSVIVDVSIDQGGCIETSRPTSHSAPVFARHGVLHYCVTNMPGAYPRTSTIALTRVTLPYVMPLAAKGIDALRDDAGFAKGVNTYRGYLTYRPVAESLGLMSRFKDLAVIDE
jgi:alanine dehydrogenase